MTLGFHRVFLIRFFFIPIVLAASSVILRLVYSLQIINSMASSDFVNDNQCSTLSTVVYRNSPITVYHILWSHFDTRRNSLFFCFCDHVTNEFHWDFLSAQLCCP